MFNPFGKLAFFLFGIFFIILLSGCTRLKMIDEKLGEIFFSKPEKTEVATSTQYTEEGSKLDFKIDNYKELTKEQKEKIDDFLKASGFNRYGDFFGTDYTGGTPLFNEATGKSLDRFQYILKYHQEIFK